MTGFWRPSRKRRRPSTSRPTVRRQADDASLAAIKRLAARQYDRPAWCRMMAGVIDGGAYDIDRRSDLEAALKRIFGKE